MVEYGGFLNVKLFKVINVVDVVDVTKFVNKIEPSEDDTWYG